MNPVLDLLKKNKLKEISQKYQPDEVLEFLSFKDGMILSCKLLLNEEMDDNLREYAVKLIEKYRQSYPKEWNENWRNDVFLGDAYHLIMKYDERYKAYKRALERTFPSPPALLVSLAGCYLLADSPIDSDEAEKLLLDALEKEKSIEAVTLIRGIYKTKGNENKFAYWDKILQDLENENAYMKDKWPKFFDNEI
ncbi:MAG: hypothetical protein WB791_11470 [Waddliaceae bacterium]